MGDKRDCRKLTGKAKLESAWDKNRRRLYKGRLLNPEVKDVPNHNISKTRITRGVGLFNAGQKSTTVKRENVSNLRNENQARLNQDLNNLLQLATERQNVFSRKNHEEKPQCSFTADSMVSNWIMSGQNTSPPRSCAENDILKIVEDSFIRVSKNVEDRINQRFPDYDKDYVKKKIKTLQKDSHRSYRFNQSGCSDLYTKNITNSESPISSPRQTFSDESPIFDKREQIFSAAPSTHSLITPKIEGFVLKSRPKAYDPPKMDFPIYASTAFIDEQQPTAEKSSNSFSYNNLPIYCAGRSENNLGNTSRPRPQYLPFINSPMPSYFPMPL